MTTAAYDPFAAGRFPVGVRTIQALDPARGRLFPCEVWYPARTGSEALRAMSLPGDAAWLPAAMRPITELCPAGQAHAFTRGLALAHLDATLRRDDTAGRFLAGDVEAELAARGVDAFAHRP